MKRLWSVMGENKCKSQSSTFFRWENLPSSARWAQRDLTAEIYKILDVGEEVKPKMNFYLTSTLYLLLLWQCGLIKQYVKTCLCPVLLKNVGLYWARLVPRHKIRTWKDFDWTNLSIFMRIRLKFFFPPAVIQWFSVVLASGQHCIIL